MEDNANIINEDLTIQAIWSSPEVYVLFLELCQIYVQVRNNLDRPVQIEKIECFFQCEDDVEPFIPIITPYLTVAPHHHSDKFRLEFKADLALKSGTNTYSIVIHYRDNNVVKKIEYNPHKFIILQPSGPNEKLFFISHKDREDTGVGRKLAHFLGKLGFKGYLSENDRKPGVDLWKEKIPSAIQSSIAMIILWTTSAAKNPENIYREIDIAKSCGKPLIMAREKDVAVPSDFPEDIEYYPVQSPVSTSELKNLACDIENTYRCGGYTK